MWWLALGLPLAFAQDAACGPGLLLAADGRCSGSTAPWALPVSGMSARSGLLPDGRLLLWGVEDVADDGLDEGPPVQPRLRMVRLDPETGEIEPIAAPFESGWPIRVDLRDPRWVMGPMHQAEDTLDAGLSSFDPATGLWTARAPNPRPDPDASSAVLDDGTLLFVGGGSREGPLARASRYLPATDRWEILPVPPTARRSPSIVPIQGGALVCGGYAEAWTFAQRSRAPLAGCERWAEGRWQQVADGVPPEGLSVVGTIGEDSVLASAQGLWVVDHLSGAFRAGPALPEPGAWASPGLNGSLRASHEGRSWLWLDGAWTAPLAAGGDGRPGAPVDLPGGWLELREGDPPALHRAGGTVDLDVGLFPSSVALPGGGVVVLGRRRGLFMDAQGALYALPAVPTSPHNSGLAALADGSLVSFGGSDGEFRPLLGTWLLPSGAQDWTRGPELPAPRVSRTLETLVSKVFAGRVWSLGAPDDRSVLSWAPGEETWRTSAAAPFEPMDAVVVGERVWVLGAPERGVQLAAWLDARGSWSALQPVAIPHRWPALAPLPDGRIVAVGGEHDAQDLLGCTHAWMVDPVAGAWTPLPDLPEGRSKGGAIALEGGRIVAIGGDRARVYWLDPGGEAWVSAPPTRTHRGRATLALQADGRIAIAGAKGEGLRSAQIERYEPGVEAEELPPVFGVSAEEDGLRARCLAGDGSVCR